jgi:RHS repeat-associated protein
MVVEPLSPPNNMTYDGENRMTAFSGNGGAASYTYDGNGLRVVKSLQGGTSTVSVFAGSSVLAEYDNGAAPGSPSREYIHGASGLLAMISGGATTYYHQDHLSVRLTTDANGNILSQDGHFPFGEQWYQSGANNKFVFTSYNRDSESGLDYALARYYDSRTGTFLMVDPVEGKSGDPQSWNRYAYARNNPIMVTDPSGKFFFIPLLIMFAESFAENMAVSFVSNSAEGHPSLSWGDVEGAALGAGLGTAEGFLNTRSFMPKNAFARAPIHFAEESFNSLVENGALSGHARVDWANVAIGTGIDVLDDYMTYKEQKANASACAASIISRVNQQFGTQAQQDGQPWYSSTGAPDGTGTMNLNISIRADQPGLPASASGSYFGGTFSPLHIPSGPGGNGGLDNPNTLSFTPHKFTAHIDSGNPHTVIGAAWHFIGDMTGWGGYRPCR